MFIPTIFLASLLLTEPFLTVAALPNPDPNPNPSNLQVVHYDGPKYTLSASDLAARAQAIATNSSWDAPASMPRITLTEGQLLDLGYQNLIKRKGNRRLEAHENTGCGGTTLSAVDNFGCGTACINVARTARSGLLTQQYQGNPYPTMDVWTSPGCTGHYQHFGIIGTYSCTDTNTGGYLSFVGYWNC